VSDVRKSRRSGAIVAAVALCGSIATAQVKPANPERVRGEDETLLIERNRNSMHDGDPLELVGLEQGNNDLRSRTPALERSTRQAAEVDVDQNYARTLAMFETGETFSTPLASLSSEPAAARAAPKRAGPATDLKPSRAGLRLLTFAVLFASFLAIAAMLWRRVSEQRAEA